MQFPFLLVAQTFIGSMKTWSGLISSTVLSICADNDDAGVKMQKECVPRLGSWRTKVVDIPAIPIGNTGRVTKDLNEILYVCGKEKVLELILDAKDSPVPSVADLSDIEPTEYEDVDGVTTGLKAIDDELMRLFFGTLTIVSGQTGFW